LEVPLEILAALIGGFLAAGTGWFLDYQREKSRLKTLRILYVTAIRDDLEHSVDLYDKVKEEWQKSKTIWYTTLNELRESRETYKNNRDHILLFKDPNLRRKIFKYYLKSSEAINLLEQGQRRKDELSRKYNELLRDIKLRKPEISDTDAHNVAVKIMEAENAEFQNLTSLLPDNINALMNYKLEASELLNSLKALP